MFEFVSCKKDRKFWNDQICAVISISMLSPNHSGYKFKKIVDWYNSQTNFHKCVIYLADTLNKYNHMLIDGSSEAEATERARYFGDKWLSNNQIIIDQIKTPHFLIRWDNQVKHSLFQEYQSKILKLYRENHDFKLAVNSDINSFFSRRGIHHDRVMPREYNLYRNYILEELAADSLLYKDMPSAWIYPGKEPEAYKFLNRSSCKEAPNGLQNYRYIRLLWQEQKNPSLRKAIINSDSSDAQDLLSAAA